MSEPSGERAEQARREPRVVLVTGGARGIGLACARAFVAAGDRVAVTYRTKPPEDDDVLAVSCDVTSTAEVDAAVDEVEERLGRVGVVVANAGANRDGLVLKMSDDAFDEVLDTNLTGAFRVARRAARSMVRARSGRLIFVSSVVGLTGSAGQVNYAASKAGLIGFSKALAREVASRQITVNVVTPGLVDTDMTKAITGKAQADWASAIPLGRLGTTEEVAAAVCFLASDEAAYITGQVLAVNGGMYM
jgi:3-oxoacyl-[acyl-carrier protein] reductase